MRIAKKEATLLLVSIFIILLSPTALAEISISKPETSYNLGDDFSYTIKLSPNVDKSDFLIATLVCGDSEATLFKSPATIIGGEQKEFLIDGKLDRFLVGGMTGVCLVRANYGGESANSPTFEITGNIRITLEISGFVFDPGDETQITGRAYKITGDPINGFVEVTFSGINATFPEKITDGSFNLTFTIPESVPGGDYNLIIRAYDLDSNSNVLNEGINVEPIKVRQVIRDIDIAIEEQIKTPGEEFIYTPLVYDQARNTMETEVEINLYAPDGQLFDTFFVKSDISNRLIILTNFTSGYWKLEASIDDYQITKTFFLEEISKLSYELVNQTLTITNVGNVPFDKPLKITIGEVSEVKDIILGVGRIKRYKLNAPNGEYDIKVGTGEEQQALGSTLLTGNAISIDEISGFFQQNFILIIWMIVILIIAIIAIYLYRKISKRRLFGKTIPAPLKKVDTSSPIEPKDVEQHKTSTMIDQGEKQETAVIAVKIRNSENLEVKNSPASKALDSALWKVKESSAKIYEDGDFRIIVLAPMLSKNKEVGLKIIDIAQTLERTLNEYNKRTAQIIDFGIGANIGELIVESKEGKFRFMSTDNTISAAKKMALSSNSETLISEKLHRKTVGKVKTLKILNQNYWKVDKIRDRSPHKGFIDKFKQKQKE